MVTDRAESRRRLRLALNVLVAALGFAFGSLVLGPLATAAVGALHTAAVRALHG